MKGIFFQLLFLFLLLSFPAFSLQSVSINGPKEFWENSITKSSLVDAQNLLAQAYNCPVEINNNQAELILYLPSLSQLNEQKSQAPEGRNYPYFEVPIHRYAWKFQTAGNKHYAFLSASSFQGVSFGIYGLLQEKLGFCFYHPRQTIVPKLSDWNLPNNQTWEAKPVFDKKGFHLHTQHPLELTEALHDPNYPNALAMVKEYLDWLVRNGQNYFEFCLLESIDRKLWPAHAKAFVDYGHSRGLLMGVDFSLHMIQQKTFQMYLSPTQSWKSKESQIVQNMKWLLQAPWDFFNMEFASAEFVGGNRAKKEKLRLMMIDWLAKNHPQTKLMGRQHVVKHDKEQGVTGHDFSWDSTSIALDKKRGILSHTVMFYDMTEPNAPVYENKNQRHQFELLLSEMEKRETWYYPESAYWVTFDNSVPLFLLPYLKARLADIDTCEKYRVPGHITFSSGWEWSYWLFDWSIARWSWNFYQNNTRLPKYPTQYVDAIEQTSASQDWIKKALALQQTYLKDSNLIQWLTGMTITDELPKGMNNAFHPRPPLSYKYLERKASLQEIQQVEKEILPRLEAFYKQTVEQIQNRKSLGPFNNSWEKEWMDGLEITALRAHHRFFTLSYILERRKARLGHRPFNGKALLDEAAKVRQLAQDIVNHRETSYRYDLQTIARWGRGHTSYDFGYLYPVHKLTFWKREEEQARRNKYGPLFMSIWNPFRIIGLVD
ncbi:MAG: hypothetical protein K1X82_08240 [Bacteroidia bacterium]|nr:hypothetical protein [Bacteroidia bacterium]